MNNKEEQEKTPFLDALIEYVKSNPIPFDVPGHKLGQFETDLSRKISPLINEYDANAPIGLDNLYNARGCIKEAEKLAADLCNADHCIFSVNGTTGGILAVMLGTLYAKDKVILPRNVHKSVINSLIVSGAVPIFVDPDIDEKLGIANGVCTETYIQAMDENPTAKAVFVINPTYFGVVIDLKELVQEAHKRNMIVIADEAHGSNFYFSSKLPCSAMDAGADVSAMSMHKNSGSLTQSSLILIKGDRVDYYSVKKAFSMFSSTSPYHMLLASLDAARKEMAMRGEEILSHDIDIADETRKRLNAIPGVHCYGKEYIQERNCTGVYDIDPTKLVIDVTGLNMYGYEVYREIRKLNNVQLELGEVSVVLAIVGPGTSQRDLDELVKGFEMLSKDHYIPKNAIEIPHYNYKYPKQVVPPREAYDAPHKIVRLKDAIGEISAETVMAYPPGIPIIIPGEVVSEDTIRLISFYLDEGGQVLKDVDPDHMKIIDRDDWYLADEIPPIENI